MQEKDNSAKKDTRHSKTLKPCCNNLLPNVDDEIVWNAGNHPSGVYFVRLQNGEFVETQKVVLMK